MRRWLPMVVMALAALPAWAENAAPPTGGAAADGAAVMYHGNAAPLEFLVGAEGQSPQRRAREATQALEAVIDGNQESDEDPTVKVTLEGSRATLRVDDVIIAQLYGADAAAANMSLVDLASTVEGEMAAFVPSQLRRKTLQLFFLHLFLSVFVLVAMVLTLRALRTAFDRWDKNLDERRASLPPVAILRVPVVSREALGGALAFGLAVGRVLTYIVTVVAAGAFVLSQFDITRPLLRDLVKWSGVPLVAGFQALVGAIPGVIVAGALFALTRAGLRVLNLLLDSVQSGQLHWKQVPPRRVAVVRNLAWFLAVLVMTPLMLGAMFGRFGTPLETIALGGAFVVLVGAVPVAASAVTGVIVLWTEGVRPGDWVEVGDVSGEVTELTFRDVRVVPARGGTVSIPYLSLATKAVHRLREPPQEEFVLTVLRDKPAKEILNVVRGVVTKREPDAKVQLCHMDGRVVEFSITAPSIRAGVKEQLLLALAEAAEANAFALANSGEPV